MSSSNSNYLSVERDMYLALDNDQFELFFQPKVDPGTHMIIGMEALLRWRHPERGLIYPNDFIAIAEESKLIVPIGDWVLGKVCEEVLRWQQQGLPQIKVSINISPVQLEQDEFASRFIQILQQHNLPGAQFEVELTEQGLVKGRKNVNKALRMLSDYGISIAIDDFGRGYSSLSYLQSFPVNTLKIDRAFVREIEAEHKESCIVDAIAMMAKGLKLHMVAEGVENQLQLDYLRNLGCSEVQGHLYGEALPALEAFAMLRSRPLEGPHFILPN
jgi:EAL domain-containing protein (putative c-di-GMP-specific phosphodiesterase class I)